MTCPTSNGIVFRNWPASRSSSSAPNSFSGSFSRSPKAAIAAADARAAAVKAERDERKKTTAFIDAHPIGVPDLAVRVSMSRVCNQMAGGNSHGFAHVDSVPGLAA